MAIHDEIDNGDCCTIFPGGNGSLLDDSDQTEITMDEGYVPKTRKPYTITKQREKWTEEEHKKFLEALKLYGRAWRKIEEHVGSKTAVQIRSHAQKFFSKVARESKNSQSGSSKVLEIPPPRPKKKPMHPYPRKFALPVKTEMLTQEQPARSTSPNSSVDQEQQSPTSVLSAIASDTVGYADSGTPDGSSSPLSPHESDAPMSAQRELCPRGGSFINEGSPDAPTSTTSLKLFGKTLVVEDSTSKIPTFTPVKFQSLDIGPSVPVPFRASAGGVPFLFVPFANIASIKEEPQEDGSDNAPFHSSLTRAGSERYAGAFVPYKRSLPENEAEITRLCL